MERTVLPDGATLYTTSSATTRVARPAPGVLLCTSAGRGSADLDEMIFGELERELAQHPHVQLFADVRGLTRVDPATREKATAWGAKHLNQVATHVLVTSKLVELALSVISMLVGGSPIHFYSREKTFLEVLGRHAKGITTLPEVKAPSVKKTG